MGMLGDFAKGFLNGAAGVVADQARRKGSGFGALCSALGWSVDEWLDDRSCLLRFDGPGGAREVMAIVSESGGVGSLACFSSARPARVSPEVAAYLVRRNAEIFPAWQITTGGRGVTFSVCYRAFMPSLDAASFQKVCKALVEEAADFDAKMRSSGML